MKRTLQITASASFAILCTLLIVGWTRSWRFMDHFSLPVAPGVAISGRSWVGRLLFYPPTHHRSRKLWISRKPASKHAGIEAQEYWDSIAPPWRILGPDDYRSGAFVLPYWFPTIVAGACCALPWIRWRFSMRMLLIALTIAGIAFGTIAALG